MNRDRDGRNPTKRTMKIRPEAFRVRDGDGVNLDKWPTKVSDALSMSAAPLGPPYHSSVYPKCPHIRKAAHGAEVGGPRSWRPRPACQRSVTGDARAQLPPVLCFGCIGPSASFRSLRFRGCVPTRVESPPRAPDRRGDRRPRRRSDSRAEGPPLHGPSRSFHRERSTSKTKGCRR